MATSNKRAIKNLTDEHDMKKKVDENTRDGDRDGLEDVEKESEEDSAVEVGNIMTMFQNSFAQNAKVKRRKTENFTNASMKLSAKKVEEIAQRQGQERKKLHEQYRSQVDTVLNQWEGEITKAKDMEEKLASTFRSQQKFYTQLRVNQSKLLKDLQNIYQQFSGTLENLEKLHLEQQGDLQGELRREVSLLQKKYLMDSHNSELAKMKLNMQQLLSSSF